MHRVALLGATGSIGTSTLKVIDRHPDRYEVISVACGRQVDKCADIALKYHPKKVAVADINLYSDLKEALQKRHLTGIEVLAGPESICELASDPDADSVLQAIVGASGVAPTFAAARAGKRLLLANKESVVCGGSLLMRTIKTCGATLLPVDSEHNAIFQCLDKVCAEDRQKARIWLTCSGGPFRDKKELDLGTVTPEMALAHPTWKMGRKISIDSATLMNKGFEVIEARHLFDFDADRITVVVHPQSVLHSAVEFEDGSVIGQMGPTDMCLPIAHCLGYPDKLNGTDKRLDLRTIGAMTFEAPDMDRFPLLKYAYESLRRGGISSIVLNASNEVGVEAFLSRRIPFTGIADLVRQMMDSFVGPEPQSLEELLEVDRESRIRASRYIDGL